MSRWVEGLAAGVVAGAPLLAAALMFGLSEAGTVAISVASIAAFSSALSAWLANRSRRDVRERIGTPNGHGSVVQMMERLCRVRLHMTRVWLVTTQLSRGDCAGVGTGCLGG